MYKNYLDLQLFFLLIISIIIHTNYFIDLRIHLLLNLVSKFFPLRFVYRKNRSLFWVLLTWKIFLKVVFLILQRGFLSRWFLYVIELIFHVLKVFLRIEYPLLFFIRQLFLSQCLFIFFFFVFLLYTQKYLRLIINHYINVPLKINSQKKIKKNTNT